MYMKRLNPKTNEPFKRGDVREDGKVFYNYTNLVKADGYFTERWVSANTIQNTKAYDRTRKNAQHVRKSSRLPNGYKKICNYDKFIIAQLKNAWRDKYERGHSDEDIKANYDAFPEFLHLFGVEAND